MSDSLVAFLRAQLDEDERIARAACWDDQSDVWTARPPRASYERYTVVDYLGDGVAAVTPENAGDDGVGQHIARHDPARVLADVQADRALLAAYEAVADLDAEDPEPEFAYGRAAGLGEALRYRALRYADRSGYLEEWQL